MSDNKAVYRERLAFYLDAIKNPAHHEAIAMDLAFLKATQQAPEAAPQGVANNWHRHHVAVEKAVLVIVRNALRNDAEAGKSVRAEMLELLDAATHEIPAPQPTAQAPNANERTALDEVIGCFHMAELEGLTEALAETTDERLKDLVERRLMYALYAAEGVQP